MFKSRDPVREKEKELEKLSLETAHLQKTLEKLIQEAQTPQLPISEPSVPKTLRVENKKAQIKFIRYFLIFLFLIGYIIYRYLR